MPSYYFIILNEIRDLKQKGIKTYRVNKVNFVSCLPEIRDLKQKGIKTADGIRLFIELTKSK